MEFTIIAWDGTDSDAPARRSSVRQEHLKLCDEMIQAGTLRYAAAFLGADGAMNGSLMIVDFPTRAALDAWLAVEPYVRGRVWVRWEVRECRSGPKFQAVKVMPV